MQLIKFLCLHAIFGKRVTDKQVEEFDVEKEYQLIKEKKSQRSAMQRQAIIQYYESGMTDARKEKK